MRFLFTAVLFLVATGVSAQETEVVNRPIISRPEMAAVSGARAMIEDWRDENRIPGVSAAVSVNGRIVWSEGFGWANLEQRVPVTRLTRFRLGSVSKLFAAVGLVRLTEEGAIELDEPIQRYVPDFPVKNWPITPRQLSAHTAGIRHYRDEDFSAGSLIGQNHHFLTDREPLNVFEDDPLEFEPDTQASYSTYGFSLLAAAISGATGSSYQQAIQDLIVEPLGLRSVGADHPYFLVPDRSAFYDYRPDISENINAAFTDNSYKWAGGGYLSNAEDLVTFASALLEPGFLSAESLNSMFTPHRLQNGELAESGGAPVGIGWRIDTSETMGARYHHGGSQVGGGAILMILPDVGVAVAIVTNQTPRPSEEMAESIAELFTLFEPSLPNAPR